MVAFQLVDCLGHGCTFLLGIAHYLQTQLSSDEQVTSVSDAALVHLQRCTRLFLFLPVCLNTLRLPCHFTGIQKIGERVPS